MIQNWKAGRQYEHNQLPVARNGKAMIAKTLGYNLITGHIYSDTKNIYMNKRKN